MTAPRCPPSQHKQINNAVLPCCLLLSSAALLGVTMIVTPSPASPCASEQQVLMILLHPCGDPGFPKFRGSPQDPNNVKPFETPTSSLLCAGHQGGDGHQHAGDA